ncbi:sulfate adenylyltransferase subunit CysN [Sulfuriferula sp. AH1]|uniref:sulfate adenylyltransferase subunit CysN n=1 Tax=Sulfuriferula sp. AH1 TaxID=1985873 RepID=UPI000B3B6D62|nr:sulfate adenylyltransferase subunit CysN [Sulfuriferula sp. AH1]ARU31779.1 sulfate adenylyltransferase subunit CysN [Sulfuriferula sp. AH1]
MANEKHNLAPATDLLRFITAGSVDDGKSTLIGRLLYDSKAICTDQLDAIERVTRRRGMEGADLALLTDGLTAEREQGITIDVAYRYFATPKRKFIIADTPGHEQYTRNMVTGASTASLVVILIDARKGVRAQSRRHAYIASLLGIRHLVVAINKMDLVDYSEEVFEQIKAEFIEFCIKLDAHDIHFIPMSSLHGDMVVERGDNIPWYQGSTLLNLLENIVVADTLNLRDFRFPVQLVSRPQMPDLHDFRGYMGRIESGCVQVGDEITVLPSGRTSKVKEIYASFDKKLSEAYAPQSVILTLEDDIDVCHGDMIVHRLDRLFEETTVYQSHLPWVEKEFEAILCWLDDKPMDLGRNYLIKHTTQTVKATIQAMHYKVDVNTLEHNANASDLQTNEIARVSIKTQRPLIYDTYQDNRTTGGFIIIDQDTNSTVAAGMIC